MKRYDYYAAVTANVLEYIRDNYTAKEIARFIADNRDDWVDELNSTLWTEDSVTGNGSGSYWFSTWKAEEALCHNFDLLCEALYAFGDDPAVIMKSSEAADVTIRCYLLHGCISEALDQLEDLIDAE